MKPDVKLPVELINANPFVSNGTDKDEPRVNSVPSTVRKSPKNNSPLKDPFSPTGELLKKATSNNLVSTLEDSKEKINPEVHEEAALITERVKIESDKASKEMEGSDEMTEAQLESACFITEDRRDGLIQITEEDEKPERIDMLNQRTSPETGP